MDKTEKKSYVQSQVLSTLLEMLQSTELEAITITQLVDKAHIGRASFYRNYKSKEDVLQQEAKRLQHELEDIRKNDDPFDIRIQLIRTLEFFKQNRNFYLVLFQSGQSKIIEDSIIDTQSITEETPNVIAYTISAFSYLIYGWVIEWIKRGMKETPQEMVDLFNQANHPSNNIL